MRLESVARRGGGNAHPGNPDYGATRVHLHLGRQDEGNATGQHRAGRDIIARLRDRADRLAAEGGADRG